MLIPSLKQSGAGTVTSLSRRVNANSQLGQHVPRGFRKLIKKGEC